MKKQFLSNISKIFIKRIAEHFKDGIDGTNSLISLSEISLSETSKLKTGEKYTIINPVIRTAIESSKWIAQSLSFQINNKIIKVHLTHPIKSDKNSTDTDINQINEIKRFFQKIKIQIFAWLWVASLESTDGCSADLDIYIYFTDFKKELPKIRGEPIDELHVNTGFTYACSINSSGKNEINIYRKEEWFKVLIHESFHAFAIDYSNISSDIIERIDQKVLREMFPLHIDLRFYETYCELWAEILQIVYMNYTDILENKWTRFERMIKADQQHSVQQAVKVLKHQNMTYSDLFDSKESGKLRRMKYKEISPVFSYYLLKSIFYIGIDNYISWCSIHNRGTLQLRKTESALNSYVGLLKELHRSPLYLKSINEHTRLVRVDGGNYHLKMSCFSA
jgi:hypothetical protein